MAFMSSMNIPINEEYDDLSTIYWIPKLHRNPYRERYITSPSTKALLRHSGTIILVIGLPEFFEIKGYFYYIPIIHCV
jgi:hypothetical protein